VWRTEEDFYAVKALAQLGLSDYAIAARTGIDRSTVNRWRHREQPPRHRLPADPWRVHDPSAYSSSVVI
jgi:transposase